MRVRDRGSWLHSGFRRADQVVDPDVLAGAILREIVLAKKSEKHSDAIAPVPARRAAVKMRDDVQPAQPAVAIPGMPTGEEKSTVSDTEADEMEQHLHGLGYLE